MQSTNWIFLNYRRDDTAAVADSIFGRLKESFGDVVFKDVDGMPAGRDFREYILSVMTTAQVVLIIVGPDWLRADEESGQPRLFDEDDTLRSEIEAAIDQECLIVPVHVRGVGVPRRQQLPESIQPIVDLTWYEFDPKHAGRDRAEDGKRSSMC